MYKALRENDPREMSLPFIKYYYAHGLCEAGLFNEALEQVLELKKIYIALRITDDTFVFMRGVPFLSQTLELVKKIYINLGIDFAKFTFVRDLLRGVDGEGRRLIKQFIKMYKMEKSN